MMHIQLLSLMLYTCWIQLYCLFVGFSYIVYLLEYSDEVLLMEYSDVICSIDFSYDKWFIFICGCKFFSY